MANLAFVADFSAAQALGNVATALPQAAQPAPSVERLAGASSLRGKATAQSAQTEESSTLSVAGVAACAGFAVCVARRAGQRKTLRAGKARVVASAAAGSAEDTKRDPNLRADGSSMVPDEPTLADWWNNPAFAMSKNLARQTLLSGTKEPEPLPPIWDWMWENLDFLQPGKKGEPINFGDVARTFKINIEQIFGGIPAPDGAPLAAADVEGLDFKALFLGMKTYFDQYGSVFKMCFGPKSFLVVSDPVVAKHILKDNVKKYDKGALSVVLEDIMGKGLIPADPVTWAKRRRAIAPAFHKLYLQRMVHEFGAANLALIPRLKEAARTGARLDMEERYGSLALDIIGKSVFNYDFNSVDSESPVVKAAIRTLAEVEHRALTPLPYWKVPGMSSVLPRLKEFETDMAMLDNKLYELINLCLDSRDPQDLENLEKRDYDKVKDPSMLRFLVDLRGEECDNKQMRDDLITLLIAGHETTAATMTFATYALSQHPEELKKVQKEIDTKVGDRVPTMEDIADMPHLQDLIAETLRLWPAPPLLIRSAIEEDHWPEGGTGIEGGCKLERASDLFISTYNMGRSPQLWENPNKFDTERWSKSFSNPKVAGWAGYNPALRSKANLYPNEITSDYAFLPFGAGERKCVGDRFATLEAAVSLIMLLRRFEFELDMEPVNPELMKKGPEQPGDEMSVAHVGMKAAATIHTATGLFCKIKERFPEDSAASDAQSKEAPKDAKELLMQA
eukprot:TRINITY_DN29435_c0_g1_i1.p1 TRINITY_DN29435_c0_g1~~TRINITY_DN29435_c0_g1_i1.p1  ORF type:complete len:753 (+),score=223.63 TRINITY_DN29435_c0_g1_i1:55-2259(+)